jgi:gamma-glutamylcyclotransferase (GGCT)/AIG2-like uncharacterized protein YtfP
MNEIAVDNEVILDSKKVAVYGSLKKGKYNHPLIEGCKKIDDIFIKGTLYSLGSYPAITLEGDNYFEAEVYELPDENYQRVKRMELGAGYQEVMIGEYIVYYADESLAEYCAKNAQVIESY